MTDYPFFEPAILYAGVVVEVVDPKSPMVGWRGVVTKRAMWSAPKYKPIAPDSYRVRMDGGEGYFYGDYERGQLKVISLPDGVEGC